MHPISEKLLQWYQQNCRDLPWRKTNDPYAIMVSEIMLQQTRVNTVIDYYECFMKTFPTLQALANASEDDVLNLWKGLGYYSRARNLHKAAHFITHQLGGIFPDKIDEVKKLPGIGDYTAGAILSIAYNQPCAAVDGNVLRVISRLFGIDTDITLSQTKKNITMKVEDMIPSHHAGNFTQALMELGAIVCTPDSPACDHCPVLNFCIAFQKDLTSVLPVKKKKEKPKVLKFFALLFIHEGKILLTRERKETLLKDMWGVPLLDLCEEEYIAERAHMLTGVTGESIRKVGKARHIFTHRIWEMEVLLCAARTNGTTGPGYYWFPFEALDELPIPTAFMRVLKIGQKYIV